MVHSNRDRKTTTPCWYCCSYDSWFLTKLCKRNFIKCSNFFWEQNSIPYVYPVNTAQHGSESHGIELIGSLNVRIENNYIESGGENMIVGTNASFGIITADVTISGNHFFKPLAWEDPIPTGPNADGTRVWKNKNLFELKEGQRFLIEGNLFENNWPQGQVGFAVLFKDSSKNGPDTVSHITFRKNAILNSRSGFAITVTESLGGLNNILIEDCLVTCHNPLGGFWLRINNGIIDLTRHPSLSE